MTARKRTPEDIFHQALAITDDSQRARFLDQACGDDAALWAEVENLLKWHDQANSFLENPPGGVQVTVAGVSASEGPGTTIDHYELLELLGEGGMGLVYLAEQKEPVRRKVALKIIKPGMDSKQVIARFEAERQTLAVLDHPNIAHVLDAGCTAAGRPYFVMEHVKGLPITRYCDQNRLTIEQRLRLFEQVCEAVHHAHQKGIIHRDLKPSNILVSVHDDRAVPKIIDFGIAKAITSPLTDKTVFTFQGQLLGTPEYMSPEQVNLATQDIDTRSDIYSLGVILYELLAGVLPFESDFFVKGGLAEIQRTIREIEAVSPSTRVTSLGDRARIIAESRGTHALALARRLHRELEWIPLKAMRKDRCRRYRSASEMADDVRNYLNGLPLIAGPETAVYRVRKFVSNHAGSVATVALVAAVIVLGLVVSTALYFKAEDARQKEAVARAQAEAARREAEVARDEAKQRAETIETMVPFYNYDDVPITRGYGRMAMDMPLDAALVTCAGDFEKEFKGPDLLKAKGYGFFGHAFESMGRLPEASGCFEKALDIRKKELGENDPLTVVSANNLALLYAKMTRFRDAEPLLVRSVEGSRRVLGSSHNVTVDSVVCMAEFLQAWASKGMECYRAGEYEMAASTLTRADEVRRSVLQKPSEIPELAYLSMALYRVGRDRDARATIGRIVALLAQHSRTIEQHERSLWAAEKTLAASDAKLVSVWERIEKGQLQQAAEELARLKTGPATSDVQLAGHLDNLARALAQAHYMAGVRNYRRGGPPQETLQNYQTAVRIDPAFANALNDLACLQATSPVPELRDAVKAVENATKACELVGWRTPLYLDTLSAAYAEAGDFDGAIRRQKEAISLFPKDDRSGNPAKMNTRLKLYESRQPYRIDTVGPMVAWWKFDEPNGQDAIDSSGNRLHGRLVGDPQRQPGMIGGALAFDGKDDYVDCGSHSAFDITNEITVAAWTKVTSFTRFAQSIVTKGDSAWMLQRWWLCESLGFNCRGTTAESQAEPEALGRVRVQDGRWHHVAGTYDGSRICLYVDGRLDSALPASGELRLNNSPLYIGHAADAPSYARDRYWHGLIDDVRVYRYALTAEEVEKLYRETGSEASQK